MLINIAEVHKFILFCVDGNLNARFQIEVGIEKIQVQKLTILNEHSLVRWKGEIEVGRENSKINVFWNSIINELLTRF